jgi:uncharacterized protein (TIGR02996 family)
MNEEAFLSALHESPDDEVTWLAIADWLDEDGQAERAELVRLVRRLRTVPVKRRAGLRARLEDRVAELLESGVRPVVPEITNGVGMRFALIPPGTFRMGSPKGEKGRSYDEAAHEVTITRAFYLGVFTVTQAQYEAVLGNNPSFISRRGTSSEKVANVSDEALANFPVEGVSWHDAVEFCRKLNGRDRPRPGLRYRLPTEAEWEYASRGGIASSGPFHHGGSLGSLQANFDGRDPYGGAPKGPALGRPCPVGSYLPNAFGLYDVHGNVWEWCSDWYRAKADPSSSDPTGPADGQSKVVRGGSWYNSADRCRAANRFYRPPEARQHTLGFRVALAAAG